MKKRLLSTLLALTLCLGPALPALAAEEDFVIEDGVLVAYNGPGQNARPNRRAASGTCPATSSMSSKRAIWTIKGLSEGLPLAAYIFRADAGFNASPPKPYTVSVGKATRPPPRNISPASRRVCSSVSEKTR